MTDLLNLGARALVVNASALQTIGNNIANANTVGYSRQSVVLATVEGQFTGGGYIGQGVDLTTIQRNHDEYLTRQAALSKSVTTSDVSRANKLLLMENVFTGGTNGLGAAVNDMLNAYSDVSSAPTDLTARTVVLSRTNEAAARFNDAASQLDNIQSGLTTELQDKITQINTLTTNIAAVNGQIQRAKGTGQSPNDLLDKRDNLINQLNQYVQTSQIEADDGTVTVLASGSQPLVLGTTAATLKVQADPQDASRSQVAIVRGNSSVVMDENMMGGGEVAGLLKFQNTDLAEGKNLLGRLAVSITTVANAQHQLGLDLDGNPGGNLFSPVVMTNGAGAPANTGSGTIALAVDPANVAKLQASDYVVTYSSSSTFTVTRKSDNAVITPDATTGSYDGLMLTMGGTANAGDSFLLQPYNTAAAKITAAFSSPRQLAVSSPVQASMGTTNTGSLSVGSLTAKSVPIPAAVTLTFTGTNTYTRSDVAGTFTYSPGTAIPADTTNAATGWSLTMAGVAQAGDTVTLGPANTSFAQLNAGNADAMLGLRDLQLFDGAKLSDGYAALMSQVGVKVQSVQYTADVSKSISDNLESSRTGVSGVNLDEEAARLLQYQQAYQASAKMIQISQSVFDSMLQSIGH